MPTDEYVHHIRIVKKDLQETLRAIDSAVEEQKKIAKHYRLDVQNILIRPDPDEMGYYTADIYFDFMHVSI